MSFLGSGWTGKAPGSLGPVLNDTGAPTIYDGLTLPFTLGDLNIDSTGRVVLAHRLYGPGYAAAPLQTAGGSQLQFNYSGSALGWLIDGVSSGAVSGFKTFIIDHPADPERYLVHACLEGPEAAVFYRGEVCLTEGGRAEVRLPDYFAALTRAGSATVQATPVLSLDSEPYGPVAATRVIDGGFVLRGQPGQHVAWQVTAQRSDVEELVIEPLRDEVTVHGEGPYRYYEKAGS